MRRLITSDPLSPCRLTSPLSSTHNPTHQIFITWNSTTIFLLTTASFGSLFTRRPWKPHGTNPLQAAMKSQTNIGQVLHTHVEFWRENTDNVRVSSGIECWGKLRRLWCGIDEQTTALFPAREDARSMSGHRFAVSAPFSALVNVDLRGKPVSFGHRSPPGTWALSMAAARHDGNEWSGHSWPGTLHRKCPQEWAGSRYV